MVWVPETRLTPADLPAAGASGDPAWSAGGAGADLPAV